MNNPFIKEEKKFLKGARGRWIELKYIGGVFIQFLRGFRGLHFIGPCVTVFGSARFKEDHPYYDLARRVSAEIGKLGFAIMTGGGPGIMEAANRGAREAGALSVGCNIVLPHEEGHNPYLDRFVTLEYFFVRKELLRKYSFAFIVLPGGFGTLDEFFETLTLIQNGKIDRFPMVVMGVSFHEAAIAHVRHMVAEKTISPEDMDLLLFTDSVEEVVAHISKHARISPGIKLEPPRKAAWLLGEKKLNGA
ncbi:LOG family protein [Parapedobacter koreensis]|uniref:Cytokinin riboside 5'-monophosphate phosphoribohydrolase n=1 Tax=Parapedobacter koreensis TaxID=332977 RepID=A0A1H7SK28_9SPHI|nr:TIGR00730 family Rossman fold protein [Parapedobacter koreensis]SEL72749.1 hypothetical protein SAMN05421740_10920 [Parapedobacter koreensis]